MGRKFDGVVYDKLKEVLGGARKAKYLDLVSCGTNFTRAAEAVGVSKRTGKAWRNGRGRSPRRPPPQVGRRRAQAALQDPNGHGRRAAGGGRGRAVPGRWGDPIAGAANKSAIGSLVERTTRFTIQPRLPDGHGAERARDAIVKKMTRLPELMPDSLTWDQVSEFARHKKIGAALGMQVYFCDPHSPWQRGSNENANGLLRQCFPKEADLSAYPEDYLDAVAEELNDRPRKTLGLMKPSELFVKLIGESEDAA